MDEYYKKFINDVAIKSTIYYIVNIISSRAASAYYTLGINATLIHLKLIVDRDTIHIMVPLAGHKHRNNSHLTTRREINNCVYWSNADMLNVDELVRLDKGVSRIISLVSPLVNKLASSYLHESKVYTSDLSNLTAMEELELINEWAG